MRITPYGVKPLMKTILGSKREGWVKLYAPLCDNLDNHEEEN